MLNTIRTNLRDLLAFLILAVFCCIALDMLSAWSASRDLANRPIPGLSLFISLLFGFSRFAAANACAWFLGVAVAWPTLNRWSHDASSFKHAWESITPGNRLTLFIVVAGFELLAAALMFTPSSR